MKYLIDSDILSYIATGDETTVRNYKMHRNDELCISPITTLEQYFGMEHPDYDEAEGLRVMKLMETLIPIPFDERAGRQAGLVRSFLNSPKRNATPLDTLLAGHALALGAVLVTNNEKDFAKIPGLRIENWSK